MRINSLKINGFLGASFDRGISMQDMGDINLIIGPNNVGKSIPYRLFLALTALKSQSAEVFKLVDRAYLDLQHFFREKVDKPITVEITFSGQDLPTEKELMIDIGGKNFTRCGIVLEHQATENFGTVVPIFSFKDRDYWACKPTPVYSSQSWQYLNRQYQYVAGEPSTRLLSTNISSAIIYTGNNLRKIRFFSTIRNTENKESHQNSEINGSYVKEKLKTLQDAKYSSQTRLLQNIIDELNDLLLPPPSKKIKQLKVSHANEIMITDESNVPNVLSNLGSGVEALTILVIELLVNKSGTVYFIEEPESHLHPGLIARFVQFLKEKCGQHQFVITTHSTAFLDNINSVDRVYRAFETDEHGTEFEVCRVFSDFHRTLDALGVKASSLLLTNTIVWVEGPSDVEYLKRWFEIIAEKNPQKSLVENSDFAFVQYGGSNIASLSGLESEDLEMEGGNKLNLLSICRRAALLADRDRKQFEQLKPHIERLIDEFEKHDGFTNTKVFTTIKREIENDLPLEVLKKALIKTFPQKLESVPISKLVLNDSIRIPELIETLAGRSLDAEKTKWTTYYDSKKTELAKNAMALMKQELGTKANPPKYVSDLVDFIIQGRTPESARHPDKNQSTSNKV